MILNEKISSKIRSVDVSDDKYLVFTGLVSETKKHIIVNVAIIKEPDTESNEKMDSHWISEFAYQLNLRLPGGLTILGFGLATDSITSDKENVITKAIQRYYKKLPNYEKLFINSDFVVVIYENEKFSGKIVSGNDGMKMNDQIKFEKLLLNSITSTITFTWDFYTSVGNTFFEKCSKGFDSLTKSLTNNDVFIKNGEIGNVDEKVHRDTNIDLLMNGWDSNENIMENETFSQHITLNVDMALQCQINHLDTFKSAISCLKLALLRSLYARIELYSLSIELVTSVREHNVQCHQMPKIITLSNKDGEYLIDYAETDDGIDEIVNEIKILIGDYAIDKNIIDSTKERFCESEEIDIITGFRSKNLPLNNKTNNNFIYLSIFILFLAILIYPILKYVL
uniref:Uncharacterized protein n=1 Tax=Strongyloides venezuelensis TaxID=75913 RepID=A0A0K0G3J9_STRVS